MKFLNEDKPSQWDLAPAQARLTYDNSINKSIGRSPFQVVYGRSPKCVVDLDKLWEIDNKTSVDTNIFTTGM